MHSAQLKGIHSTEPAGTPETNRTKSGTCFYPVEPFVMYGLKLTPKIPEFIGINHANKLL